MYISNQLLFPISVVATSYGFCNLVSRFATIFSPYIAELKPLAISEWIFVVIAGIALLSTIFVAFKKKEELIEKKESLIEAQE